jgi:chemotaxis protein CheD
VTRSGGINHYLLPYWNGDGLASPKYANIALPGLVERLLGFGCRKRDLRAKLFGGGAIFRQVGGLFGIGQRNVDFAEQYLEEAGIPVVARDVGEAYTRKVIFQLHTGEALVRRLKTLEPVAGKGR